tara:strand:+ start:1420 stop:2919 length:1500 start_codon:yes stop_codon:yes gene_type:complete
MGKILNQFGRPMSSSLFHQSGRLGSDRGLPIHFINGGKDDTHKVLNASSRENMRNAGRWLLANYPVVAGALRENATYAFPLTPRYTGRDKAWGQEAQAWLSDWDQVSELRGPNYTRLSASRARLIARKTDGDFAIRLTTNKSGDFPMISHVRGHRIHNGTEQGSDNLVEGVILNKLGSPAKYRIQTGKTSKDTTDLAARSVHFCFNPEYLDQYRGIPILGSSIVSFADTKQLREWDMHAQKMASSLVFIEHNELGEPDPGDGFTEAASGTTTSSSASGGQTQVYEQGMTKFFQAGMTNTKLEQLAYNRPSNESQAFEDKITRQALYGIGWDPDFALSLKTPGGAWARTIIEKIRRTIWMDQEIEERTLRRIHSYALGFAVKHGLLPKPKSKDWWRAWSYNGPARITADSGNERKATMDEYKLGIQTLAGLEDERGKYWRDVRDQQDDELNDLLTRAKALSGKNGISLSTAISLYRQSNPNPTFEEQVEEVAAATIEDDE